MRLSVRPLAGFFIALVCLCLPVLAVAQQPASASFSREQIDQMTAPIALYPDSLLSQVLMASTYPADVAEAAKFRIEPTNPEVVYVPTYDPSVVYGTWPYPGVSALLLPASGVRRLVSGLVPGRGSEQLAAGGFSGGSRGGGGFSGGGRGGGGGGRGGGGRR